MQNFLILMLVLGMSIWGCQRKKEKAPISGMPEVSVTADTTASGLIIQEMKFGEGEVAKAGSQVSVHYTGWFTTGRQFDSSIPRQKPLSIVLGAGKVIQGWEEGIQGMRVGGKRRLTIPPQLAYGERGYPGVIPPNSTLIFEVELISVKN